MLVMPGGRERSDDEYAALFERAAQIRHHDTATGTRRDRGQTGVDFRTRARAHPVRGQGSPTSSCTTTQTNPLRPSKRTAGADGEEIVMEHHRKQAKALVRAFRAGEPDAIRRAEASSAGERTSGSS